MGLVFSSVITLFLLTGNASAQEVQNISFSPYPQPDGSLDTEVTWDPPADVHHIAEYRMYQIRGTGQGIGSPQRLPSSVSSLRITDVPSVGPFGVSIQIVWKDGRLSHGAFASIGESNFLASVTSPASSVRLSRKDLGMVFFVIIAGAVVGTFSVRLFFRA
ncbi:hypothetical protein HYZ98_03845 [Candidatus Peregrinibacteria bacterium]|nr:hypothetical protein [Candidatus Peregrinibacteria bacterium]